MKENRAPPPQREPSGQSLAHHPLTRMEVMQRSVTNLRRRLGNSVLNANKGIEKVQ